MVNPYPLPPNDTLQQNLNLWLQLQLYPTEDWEGKN